jgi:hypothetical protein
MCQKIHAKQRDSTAASRKFKVLSRKADGKEAKPHVRMVVLPFAPTRCGSGGGTMLVCGKMDSEALESIKNLKLLCLSWRKIKFFAGRKTLLWRTPVRWRRGDQQV